MLKEALPGYWMVKVPEGYEWDLCEIDGRLHLVGDNDKADVQIQKQPIPIGQWEIVGVVSEIKEEVANGIVESDPSEEIYRNYTPGRPFWSATESLLSLARSHGFEPDQAILLNKKI